MSAHMMDETLRSRLEYGKPDYPFSCYLDRFKQNVLQCIEWHWHDECEFSYVVEGTIMCCIGANYITLEAGDGIFINTGTIHRFQAGGNGLIANFIFMPEFIASKTSLIYKKYVLPLLLSDVEYSAYYGDTAEHGNPIKLLRETYSAFCSDDFSRELKIRNLLSELWIHTVKHCIEAPESMSNAKSRVAQERLQRMILYIHKNFAHHVTLDDIAGAANISKSEALRCFRVGIETTPVKYMNDYRLTKGAARLSSSSDSVSMISGEIGFESVGYFCKAFKTHYGISPTSFRKG